TLGREHVRLAGEVAFLPPAAQGDVLRAAERRPAAIGIVDGYFSGAPSVWHKEILWALSQGIPVFGSASMGALRAAELHTFGMRGIGRIFEGYRDGLIEDDDEVAVQHGPAELGYPALSEAMVNIRATLGRAEAEGVVGAEERARLEGFAKALHFPDRQWSALAGHLRRLAPEQAAALADWLPEGRIDRKREDALEMVGAIEEALGREETPAAGFRFEWTSLWDSLVARAADREGPGSEAGAVLEELRLEGPEAVERVRARALLRRLAAREGRGAGTDDAGAALIRLREAQGLWTRAALDDWLAENALDAPTLELLLVEEARLERLMQSGGGDLDRDMLDELRLRGDYARLARRAREKPASVPPHAPVPGTLELRLWYFERRLGRPMPEDLAGHARTLGFADVREFDDALRREYVYRAGTARQRDY
ncbi:MAG TPA: TfuA-like protein, partial [Thermohalobaculum sp.]|nr:TfuA-like protein [Thermohalobaculum sp.]